MTDEKRTSIRELLGQRGRSAKESAEKFVKDLENEPRARVRRTRSKAIISIEDIKFFSELLLAEFPDLIYFFANYKTGNPTPSKFSTDVPITLFPTLHAAILASLEIEKQRPAYNGPNFNRPDIFCRLPWPDERTAGIAEQLIGGREFPDDAYDLAFQYRDLGQWFMLHYPTKGYLYPRMMTDPRKEWTLDDVKSPEQRYMPFQVLDSAQSEFFTLYDLNDEETMSFAKRAHALWRRTYTNKVAHYDPATGEIVQPADWDGKFSWNIGKQALANALSDPPRYAGFAPRSASDGSPLMLGPVPKPVRKIKQSVG
nr:hypothetical protein [uncultured Dongia sp.]